MGISPRQLLNRYMLKKFSGKEWFGINEENSINENDAGYEHGDHDFGLWRARNECRGREDSSGQPTHEWIDGEGCRKIKTVNNEDVDEDPNDPTSKWPGDTVNEPKKEKTSLFVGSISPREGLHKIMLTDSGHVVLVYQDSFEGASSRWTGHVHNHPDGELINRIKINPAEIGE